MVEESRKVRYRCRDCKYVRKVAGTGIWLCLRERKETVVGVFKEVHPESRSCEWFEMSEVGQPRRIFFIR